MPDAAQSFIFHELEWDAEESGALAFDIVGSIQRFRVLPCRHSMEVL